MDAQLLTNRSGGRSRGRLRPALPRAIALAAAVFSILISPLATPPAGAATVRMARQARLDVLARAPVGALNDGVIVDGDGTITRMTWLATEQERGRSYTMVINITHLGWTQISARFIPAKSGGIDLVLMGPWDEERPGVIYQEEVLWDDARATGAAFANGSFEESIGSALRGWRTSSGLPQIDTGPLEPAHGTRYVRTWHNRTLTQSLQVQAGVPVTVQFASRAYRPADFVEMRRIERRDTPAHQAALRFMRGVNLGNYLEAPRGEDWGANYNAADFDHIRAEGFDHVRLPIAWHHHTGVGPDFRLSTEVLTKADFLVNHALARGLRVIVDIHHFDAFTDNPLGQAEKFYALWRQLASHYAGTEGSVAFELLNEPRGAATTEAMNPIYTEAIRQIRAVNPARTIFVGPGNWNRPDELPLLRLPDNDENLIATVHSYDPFLFTHQGANWTLPDTATQGIIFPGPPTQPVTPDATVTHLPWIMAWFEDYNRLPADVNPCSSKAFRGWLQRARQWSDYYGRPVHVGEFGAFIIADPGSRARYYKAMRESMDELGFGWALWDWKAGFRYWDGAQPAPGLRDAVHPAPKLRATSAGVIEWDGARGKSYQIERVYALDSPPGWRILSTETLVDPLGRWVEPPATLPAQGFYRVKWLK